MEQRRETTPDLLCPVCHSQFQAPRVISCSHVFCSGCILALTQNALAAQKPDFSCPLCRAKQPVDPLQADPLAGFQEASFIEKLLDAHKAEIDHGENVPHPGCDTRKACSTKDCDSPACCFCQDGCGHLCEACKNLHSKFIGFSCHRIMEQPGPNQTPSSIPCLRHPQNTVRYMCDKCVGERYMCVECAFDHARKYPSHSEISWTESRIDITLDLPPLSEKIQDIVARQQKCIDIYERKFIEGEDRLELTREKIKAEFALYKEQVNSCLLHVQQTESEVLAKLGESHQKAWKGIEMEYDSLQTQKLATEHSVRFAEHTLKRFQREGNPQLISEAKCRLISVIESCKEDEVLNDLGSFVEVKTGTIDFLPFTGNVVTLNIPKDYKWLRSKSFSDVFCRMWKSKADGYRYVKHSEPSTAGGNEFNCPFGISVNPVTGNLYITERDNHRVRVLDENLAYICHFGGRGSKVGQFTVPTGISTSLDGFVAVAERDGNRIQIFDASNEVVKVIQAGNEKSRVCPQEIEFDGFAEPMGVAFDRKGNLFVANRAKNRVDKFNSRFEFECSFANIGSGESVVERPEALCVTSDDKICVVGHAGNKINMYTEDGSFAKTIPIQKLANNAALVEGPGKTLFVSDQNLHNIIVYDLDGKEVHRLGSKGQSAGQFSYQIGICFGVNECLYICDFKPNNRIHMFSSQ